jgi:hypothetical protein
MDVYLNVMLYQGRFSIAQTDLQVHQMDVIPICTALV